jgi:hypothetical protein
MMNDVFIGVHSAAAEAVGLGMQVTPLLLGVFSSANFKKIIGGSVPDQLKRKGFGILQFPMPQLPKGRTAATIEMALKDVSEVPFIDIAVFVAESWVIEVQKKEFPAFAENLAENKYESISEMEGNYEAVTFRFISKEIGHWYSYCRINRATRKLAKSDLHRGEAETLRKAAETLKTESNLH